MIWLLHVNYFSIAVSNAIRTSLGPRGMDKMVSKFYIYFIFIYFNKVICNTNLICK